MIRCWCGCLQHFANNLPVVHAVAYQAYRASLISSMVLRSWCWLIQIVMGRRLLNGLTMTISDVHFGSSLLLVS